MKEFTKKESLNQLKAFDLFENTLILKFRYDENEFIWEGIRTNWTLDRGQREFMCIEFENVSGFKRIIPIKNSNKFKDMINEFSSKNINGTYESESSTILKENDSFRMEITLPYLLGKIIFSFTHVKLRSKIGIGEQVTSESWKYKDLETDAPFDFYKPFE